MVPVSHTIDCVTQRKKFLYILEARTTGSRWHLILLSLWVLFLGRRSLRSHHILPWKRVGEEREDRDEERKIKREKGGERTVWDL